MSLLESHTIKFHRFVKSGKDALGNSALTTEAPGFPVSARGLFEQSSRPAFGDAGVGSARGAVVRSSSVIGRVGDYIEFRGSTYLITGSTDNRHVVGYPHFRYDVTLEEVGNRAKFNESDPDRVSEGV